jgi:hypothetical protein
MFRFLCINENESSIIAHLNTGAQLFPIQFYFYLGLIQFQMTTRIEPGTSTLLFCAIHDGTIKTPPASSTSLE